MANERTTMSVPEMQRMLGIKKTDAYWLVHKNVFETIIVEKKMRVVIESFEKWYANQVKHSKVDGPPPGAELKAYSYSVQEMANLLGVSDDVVYAIIKRDHIETFEVDYWKRIRKDLFISTRSFSEWISLLLMLLMLLRRRMCFVSFRI